jgi:hypothetical protein
MSLPTLTRPRITTLYRSLPRTTDCQLRRPRKLRRRLANLIDLTIVIRARTLASKRSALNSNKTTIRGILLRRIGLGGLDNRKAYFLLVYSLRQ